jgi:hypothetical protein
MQNNYFLKLIDSNEASNIVFDIIGDDLFFDVPEILENNDRFQNKLLILCSDEEIKKNDLKYRIDVQILIKDNKNTSNSKKVIATNSPTLTPNCYFSEDRVKEFVEYWNKWKEFPKFEVENECTQQDINGDCTKNTIGCSNLCPIKTNNNQIQIKWLPKEEERERGITITSLSSKKTNLEQKLTPLAQLIEEIESLRSSKIYINPNNIINDCIVLCYAHLEEEKQMVIDAYKEGCFDNILDERTDKTRAEQYFNQNFKQ